MRKMETIEMLASLMSDYVRLEKAMDIAQEEMVNDPDNREVGERFLQICSMVGACGKQLEEISTEFHSSVERAEELLEQKLD